MTSTQTPPEAQYCQRMAPSRRTMRYPYRQLEWSSNFVMGFAWLIGLGGIIGGLFVAFQPGADGYTYPYVGFGVAMILAAVVSAVFMTWLGYFGKVAVANGRHEYHQVENLMYSDVSNRSFGSKLRAACGLPDKSR